MFRTLGWAFAAAKTNVEENIAVVRITIATFGVFVCIISYNGNLLFGFSKLCL
jgi:hypothetical protein